MQELESLLNEKKRGLYQLEGVYHRLVDLNHPEFKESRERLKIKVEQYREAIDYADSCFEQLLEMCNQMQELEAKEAKLQDNPLKNQLEIEVIDKQVYDLFQDYLDLYAQVMDAIKGL